MIKSKVTTASLRFDFETWVRSFGYSVSRYRDFPFSYKNTDLDGKWATWEKCAEYYDVKEKIK